ncbi:G-type lectin S-receptor-like serine/threonine-protein kinase [Pyrus ussuriensis x Pyrus communis]|uniref:G-type lectin S-receptor-like serine/threonine-protein kinase n=1 Tax=Pyrus ussuriensis x Pyrus communis TaxID=2448454 RepID=A0A5N5I3A5_9ROSA|nr:G-type lectin S-receptor-like serine/threonine-protein kinase [Pyrus ussuriensis x Pyrus communis]
MGISEFTASIPVCGNGTSSSKPGTNYAKSTISDGLSSSYCVCPSGFRESAGEIKDGGCERKIKLTNLGNTRFERLDYVNFMDKSNQTNWLAVNFSVCESRCLAKLISRFSQLASIGGFERDDMEHCDYMHPFRGGADFPFQCGFGWANEKGK